METKLYYTEPPQDRFDELKKKAVEVWQTYDNEFGYVDEKVERIKDIKNVQDNFMYIVAMFDLNNQKILASKLSDETRIEVRLRMVDGGNPPQYIVF